MKKALLCALLTLSTSAFAHFGVLLPSSSTVSQPNEAKMTLQAAFAHPMEQQGMTMAKPRVSVISNGQSTDLSSKLKSATTLGKASWTFTHSIKQPGVYQFFCEPQPYWEPAEDKFIIHYTKVIVGAFGEEEGWNEPIGVKTEIVPLTRPFANYAGNVFSGRVMLDGKPAANTAVEVEYWNKDKAYQAPNDYCVTQVVMTDDNGIFHFAAPWAGWWGFAALSDSDKKIARQGKDKDVEIGAVLWTEFLAPQR